SRAVPEPASLNGFAQIQRFAVSCDSRAMGKRTSIGAPVFDPVTQFEEDAASRRRRPRHAARHKRAAIYFSVVLLAATAGLLTLLVVRGMPHESPRPVADRALTSASAAPSTSYGGVDPQALVAQSAAPSVAASPSRAVAPSPTAKGTPAGTTTKPPS